MRYLFIIQGEGRGHMTQAISLGQILRGAGHEIVHAIIGKSPKGNIPEFLYDTIGTEITEIDTPHFISDKIHKSVKPFRSIVYSIFKSPIYKKSIEQINQIVKKTEPDVIVNFYDFLAGIFNFFYRPKANFVCLAHQYLLAHPDFDFPQGKQIDRATLRIANRITSLGSAKILALSFQPFQETKNNRITVVPPLLREDVKQIKIEHGNHILAYVVNPGYGEEIKRFHEEYPEYPIYCFWDNKSKPATWQVDETLTFYQLDDCKFLEKMASCMGYISTAGFESICEAMYLGKPVMMIPVKGHYEQECNAMDAKKAGAGIHHHEFDISILVNYLPNHKNISSRFHEWTNRNTDIFLKELS